ncbi:DUF134 domain-containing protein [Methanobacterium sp. ACI-7]|uniref:DUF134 domain-containing protein n=1 Tax=unclassified Methanobacterium TaxID=2627676 RepID=UPI0039C3F4BB
MVRPKKFRQILQEPQNRCFEPHSKENIEGSKSIEITVDEFEAIRLRDYNSAKQKEAAKDMEISQPTFNRILTSGRKKIARALIEGKNIKIKGGILMANDYKCKNCGFKWSSPEKEYEKCPECKSEDISKIDIEEVQKTVGKPGMRQRRGYGGQGMGAGSPRVCKCNQCGYESSKTPGVPCRNFKCPECGAPLCGAD